MAIFHVAAIPAIFAGASMTATSIGITASVFGELGYLRTREGQIVIGAAVLDDILGIVILAVVVAVGGWRQPRYCSDHPVGRSRLCLFVAVALVLEPHGSARLRLGDRSSSRPRAPGLVGTHSLILGVSCFAATAIGLEAALGAFAAGLIAQHLQAPPRHSGRRSLPIVGLFATVFFVLVGAGMDLSVINPSDPAVPLRPADRRLSCSWLL